MSMPPLLRTPAEVTPEWLTDVLRAAQRLRDRRVVALTSEQVGTGQMGTSVRYTLSYDGAAENAPTSVVCKFASADPTSRATGLAMRIYEVEVNFYRQVAGTVNIRMPGCYFGDIDLGTGEFVLVLEDMTPCRQGDQLSGCSIDQAALALEELAKLHAPRWADERLAQLPWLNRNTPESLALVSGFLPALFPGFVERYGGRLQPEHVALGEKLVAGLVPWMSHREGPFSIQHGDYRLDNMLFGVAGSACPLAVVDWQTVVWGPPVADASYFLGAGLPVEERRANERALLRHYYDALRAGGVAGFSWDRCWRDYRRYAFSGLLMAIAASMMVVQTDRGDEMFLTMARRHGAHILDLEATELLDG